MALYDEAADIYDVAAAYAYNVAQNQPFLDGNKRAGLAAAASFLFVNVVHKKANGSSQIAKKTA